MSPKTTKKKPSNTLRIRNLEKALEDHAKTLGDVARITKGLQVENLEVARPRLTSLERGIEALKTTIADRTAGERRVEDRIETLALALEQHRQRLGATIERNLTTLQDRVEQLDAADTRLAGRHVELESMLKRSMVAFGLDDIANGNSMSKRIAALEARLGTKHDAQCMEIAEKDIARLTERVAKLEGAKAGAAVTKPDGSVSIYVTADAKSPEELQRKIAEQLDSVMAAGTPPRTPHPSEVAESLQQEGVDRAKAAYDHGVRDGLAKAKPEIDAWTETAREYAKTVDYLRGLLDKIGKAIGHAAYVSDDGSVQAYVSDDGSVQDSPLCAKLPELVVELVARAKASPQQPHEQRLALAAAMVAIAADSTVPAAERTHAAFAWMELGK